MTDDSQCDQRPRQVPGAAGTDHDAAAQRISTKQSKKSCPLVTYLVGNKISTAGSIAETVSREFGLPLLDLDAFVFEMAPVKVVSERLIRQHRILPLFKRGNRLFVALVRSDQFPGAGRDQVSDSSVDRVRDRRGGKAVPVRRSDAGGRRHPHDGFARQSIWTTSRSPPATTMPGPDVEPNEIDDAPIVRFVNKILVDAIKQGRFGHSFRTLRKVLSDPVSPRRPAARSGQSAGDPLRAASVRA